VEKKLVFKASAHAATTATLIPQTSQEFKGDMADTIADIVVTFTSARDDKFFDVLNREYEVTIRRR